jgi:transcription termination factor 2
VWKKQIDAAGKVGQDRLRALLGGLLLRRLKSDVTATGTPLVDLPSRHHVQHTLTLNPAERAQYQLILRHGREAIRTTGGCDALVRLNHLRQICCDPTLISKAPADAQPTCANVADLAMSLDRMGLYDTGSSITSTSAETSSTKIKAVVTLTESLVTTISPEGLHNKAIIVSQWTGFLDLIAAELDRHGLKHVRLDGSVEVGRRQTIVDTFNSAVGTSDSPPPVLLLSLKAGGVGLNLVGANHCLVADLPYNPATLDQACDRIYRLGQKRSVTIHKFICANTIEEWQLRLLVSASPDELSHIFSFFLFMLFKLRMHHAAALTSLRLTRLTPKTVGGCTVTGEKAVGDGQSLARHGKRSPDKG